MDLTPDQINQLQSLGISVPSSHQDSTPPPPPVEVPPEDISKPITNESEEIKTDQDSAPSSQEIVLQPVPSSKPEQVLDKPKNPIVPILSISGLTLLSFGGILLFKTKQTPSASVDIPQSPTDNLPVEVSPTQVPKSIQHYLLTSQQYFTKALQIQNASAANTPAAVDQNQMTTMINQSILAASDAIKEFPDDYRGWEQRGRIYQSLAGSQAQMLSLAISDFSKASQLNPSSIETAHTLASLYAQTGDANNTLKQLTRIVTIEPTKAQNFYDLARLQQQTGHLPQALDAYNRLLSLLTDSSQKQQIETEKASIEKLIAQSPVSNSASPSPSTSSEPLPASSLEGNLIQASAQSELIIAAPETAKKIEVTNLTSSNSLSGNAVLSASNKQISLTNSNLTASSQVYLTITKGGKNLSLQVLSRSGNTFVVGLDSPATEDIEFKWWIVNP